MQKYKISYKIKELWGQLGHHWNSTLVDKYYKKLKVAFFKTILM